MESLNAQPMNHFPFIAAAFGIGLVMIVGYCIWLMIENVQLKRHLTIIDESQKN